MNDWVAPLIDPSFMPHGHCYLWRPDILWTHVIADLAIGISYFIIPIALAILLFRRKQGLPHPELFSLFIAFIFFCGTTHLVSVYVTWNPAYQYQGWLKALTAFTSVLTVIVLVPKLPALMALTGIEAAYKESQKSLLEQQEINDQMRLTYSATLEREERIIELKREVNRLSVLLDKPT